MNTWRHRFRVWFEDGTSRDVMAQSEAGAMRTAASAQRLVGYRGPATKPVNAKDCGHLGTDQAYCSRCAQKTLPFKESA